MNRIILYLLDHIQALYRWYGVDYQMVRAIVEIKLLMDNRRSHGGMQQLKSKTEDDTSGNKFYLAIGIYAFVGLFLGLLIFGKISLYMVGILVFGYAITFTGMMLLADFSNVLFDTRDNAIILPRPVTGKTILVARITHISIYVLLLNLAMCFFFMLFSLFKVPQLTPLVLVLVIISALLGVFFTIIIYLVLMRFISEERFKDFIVWVQILLTVFSAVAYQLLPRLITKVNFTTTQQTVENWQYFVPPAWLGGTLHAFHKGQFTTPNLIFIALTFLSPLVCIGFIVKVLAPTFDKRLAGLGTASTGGGVEMLKTEKTVFQLSNFFAKYLCKSQLEKAIFSLSWKITSRDRTFKMQSYPSFGAFIPMFYFGVLSGSSIAELSDSSMYIMFAYFSYLIGSTFYSQSFFSESTKATWTYFVMPVTSPKEVLFGNLKAIVVKFFLPIFMALSTFILYVWGWKILPDLGLSLVISLLFMILETGMSSQYALPFSRERVTRTEAGGQTMRMVMLLVLLPIVGLIHWGLTYVPYGVWAGLAVACLGLWQISKRFDKVTWEDFE